MKVFFSSILLLSTLAAPAVAAERFPPPQFDSDYRMPAKGILPADLSDIISTIAKQGSFSGCAKLLDREVRIKGEVLQSNGEREGIVMVIDEEDR